MAGSTTTTRALCSKPKTLPTEALAYRGMRFLRKLCVLCGYNCAFLSRQKGSDSF